MISFGLTFGPTWYWYFTRATGLVALVLLTAILVLGILGPLRISSPTWPRFAVDTLHRDISLLAIVVIAIHVIVSVLDGFAPISLLDGVIPFHSAYRPLWLGLGAVAFDLMLAVAVTSLVRRRIGYRAWRAVHWLSYACWPLAVLHGLGTGTDANQMWALVLTFLCVIAVEAAFLARVRGAPTLPDSWRRAAVAAVIGTPLAFGVFAVVGPLAPHWAARAGTPAPLLARVRETR